MEYAQRVVEIVGVHLLTRTGLIAQLGRSPSETEPVGSLFHVIPVSLDAQPFCAFAAKSKTTYCAHRHVRCILILLLKGLACNHSRWTGVWLTWALCQSLQVTRHCWRALQPPLTSRGVSCSNDGCVSQSSLGPGPCLWSKGGSVQRVCLSTSI